LDTSLDDAVHVQSQLLQLKCALTRWNQELQGNGFPRCHRVVVAVGRRTRPDSEIAAVHGRGGHLTIETDWQLWLEWLHQQREIGGAETEIGGLDLVGRLFEPADQCWTAHFHT